MREAIGCKLLSDISLHSLDNFMRSVAIFLWICAVTTLATAYGNLFSLTVAL
jgi:hypothetical protein